MSVPRFHCAAPLDPGDIGRDIDLPPSAARHAVQVLRLRAGDAIVLFGGDGGEFAATLARVDRRGVTARIDRFDAIEREPSHSLTLVQSIITSDMMDLVVRKATELGVCAIAPVMASRSQRLPHERMEKRAAHWRQIAIAACEQSGRNRIPQVLDVRTLAQWIDESRSPHSGTVVLDPTARTSLVSAAEHARPDALIVGPEGGFTTDELEHVERKGMRRVTMGARQLRAETAAIAALAVIDAIAGAGDTATAVGPTAATPVSVR